MFIRTAAATLAIAATATPAALAQDYRNPDNRVIEPVPTGQYLSPDARDRAERHATTTTTTAVVSPSASAPTRRFLNPDARDRAERRTTPDVLVVSAPKPAAAPTTATGGGINWADAGLGAGGVLGLALITAGGALVVVRRHGTRGLTS
jgi:hypothetical protein